MDTVARMGGDEFVIVIAQLNTDETKSKQEAETLAKKICIDLARPYKLIAKNEDGESNIIEHCCTASIGITLFSDDKLHVNDILRNADDAMYQAKNAGRNQISFYAPAKITKG